jgi:hypothetical protein
LHFSSFSSNKLKQTARNVAAFGSNSAIYDLVTILSISQTAEFLK